MTKTIIAAMILCFALSAQSLPISGPSGMQKAGTTVQLGINLSGSANSSIAALQFTVAGATGLSAAAGTAAVAAGKQIACAQVGTNFNCILFGLNQTDFADGQVAVVNLPLSRTTGIGTVTVTMSNSLGATDGKTTTVTGVPITAAAPFSFGTTSLCDVNADGKVDVADLNFVVPQITGAAACTSDMDSNGRCDAVDGMIVVAAALGGACQAK